MNRGSDLQLCLHVEKKQNELPCLAYDWLPRWFRRMLCGGKIPLIVPWGTTVRGCHTAYTTWRGYLDRDELHLTMWR